MNEGETPKPSEQEINPRSLEDLTEWALNQISAEIKNQGGIVHKALGLLKQRQISQALKQFREGNPELAVKLLASEATRYQDFASLDDTFSAMNRTSLPGTSPFKTKVMFYQGLESMLLTKIDEKKAAAGESFDGEGVRRQMNEVIISGEAVPQGNQYQRLLDNLYELRESSWPSRKS